MRVATLAFGPFDVCTIAEIVDNIDQYNESEAIYIEDVKRLTLSTPAVVTSEHIVSSELEEQLGFRYLADIDSAKEAIDYFGGRDDEEGIEELLEMIEEYGM